MLVNIWKILVFWILFDGIEGAADKKPQKATRSVVITAEEEKGRDPHGYQAIAEIHREMDDDHSGSIDRAESTGFMTEDMNMRGSDARRREKAFHGEDDAITIDDLWEAWFESEERAWSNEEVLQWVVNVVNLPQYAGVISSLNIDGRYLPRLAVHNSTFMTNTLGIKSSVHRQKLRLNALDVVLFGYRDPSSRGKDIALALLLLLLTSLIVVFVRQRRRARSQLSELHQRLNQLKTMENEFEDVQKKFEDERSKRNNAEGASQSEMELLREQLDEAHKRLGNMEVSGSATPLALQPLLRKTCEMELQVVEKEKQACIEDMKAAMEIINNVAKRQGSLLNSLKLATGANTGADKVDSQIYTIKQRMERVHANTRELQERWMQIESLCGFPVLYHNEGTANRHINGGVGQFYRGSGSSSTSSKSLNSNVIKSAAAVATRTTMISKASSEVAPSTLASSSMTPKTNGQPIFYAQTPERIERIEEHMYNSMQSLPVGDSVSMTHSPPAITVKEKKKKLFGLFKKNSSKSLSTSSNGITTTRR